MKTSNNFFSKLYKVVIVVILISSFSGLMSCGTTTPAYSEAQYTNPTWAPPYYSGVRYYYLPDIETYYDLSGNDFVYLDNGQWLFSNSLPLMYNGYDLYNGYAISLNTSVYQPWMHHHFYVSNYPRYYYHSLYHGAAAGNVRGYNENIRQPYYWKPEDRNRINELKINEQHNPVQTKPQVVRPPQNPSYPGKNIGRPVRVKPNMRQNRQEYRNDNRTQDKRENNRQNKSEEIHP